MKNCGFKTQSSDFHFAHKSNQITQAYRFFWPDTTVIYGNRFSRRGSIENPGKEKRGQGTPPSYPTQTLLSLMLIPSFLFNFADSHISKFFGPKYLTIFQNESKQVSLSRSDFYFSNEKENSIGGFYLKIYNVNRKFMKEFSQFRLPNCMEEERDQKVLCKHIL